MTLEDHGSYFWRLGEGDPCESAKPVCVQEPPLGDAANAIAYVRAELRAQNNVLESRVSALELRLDTFKQAWEAQMESIRIGTQVRARTLAAVALDSSENSRLPVLPRTAPAEAYFEAVDDLQLTDVSLMSISSLVARLKEKRVSVLEPRLQDLTHACATQLEATGELESISMDSSEDAACPAVPNRENIEVSQFPSKSLMSSPGQVGRLKDQIEKMDAAILAHVDNLSQQSAKMSARLEKLEALMSTPLKLPQLAPGTLVGKWRASVQHSVDLEQSERSMTNASSECTERSVPTKGVKFNQPSNCIRSI